jgi:hypothetical protein
VTGVLAVLGVAVLFVVFGLLTRGRRRPCGGSCACAAALGGERDCTAERTGKESRHDG